MVLGHFYCWIAGSFNQMSSLASTMTLSLVILWCSCAQCLTDVCEGAFRALHLVYQATFLSVRRFVLRMYHDGSNDVDEPMVSPHPMCFEHTCECLGGALYVRQANIGLRPGPCRCSALLLLGSRDLEHPLFVPIGLQSVLDVGHIIPSTIRAGDHDFCSPHECAYHRPFVLEVMVGAEV